MPTWSNSKNNHDEGIMQICCSHENSIDVQACRNALFAESALKSLISLSNDVHLKEKSLETVGNSYTSLRKSAISKMFTSNLSDRD